MEPESDWLLTGEIVVTGARMERADVGVRGETVTAVGADADLVVFDPAREFTIWAENQLRNVGYTLHEGQAVLG